MGRQQLPAPEASSPVPSRPVPSPLRGASRGCLFKIAYSSHPPPHRPPKFRKDRRLSRRTEQTSFQSGKGRRRRKQGKDGEGVARDSRESPLWLPTGSRHQRPRNLLPASSDRRAAQTRASHSHHPGFVRPSAPGRTSSAEGAAEKVGPFSHLGRRRSLMAAGEGERRGAAPRRQRTVVVGFRRPPRPPPRVWALTAARVEAAGGEYPSVPPVPQLLPVSPPRLPMSQAPWYRPPAAAQRRDAGRAYPEPRTQEEAGPGGRTRPGTSRTPCRCPKRAPARKQSGTRRKSQARF